MKTLIYIFALSLFLTIKSFCYEIKYLNLDKEKVDSLKSKADAIILNDQTIFKIIDESNAEYTSNYKILILNQNADGYCRFAIKESEYVKIDDIEACIKDTSGNLLKELDSDDIHESESSIGSFYSGDLYKRFELNYHVYPFIIEVTIKKEYNSLFLWPDWYPQSRIPTIQTSYQVINETNVNFSYFPINIDIKPQIENVNSIKKYTWELTDLPKVEYEDFMPPEFRYSKSILFKADKFSLDDYYGSSENWNKFGLFYNSLTKDKYDLPEQAKEEVKSLVKEINDPKEKVKTLYKYLQQNNRYVDIEIGINGWQPQSASEVYKNHYGDCKDLSTYMVAMLNTVGIKAYPALALTRNKGMVYTDFACAQFNHCIVMSPLDKDTLWLECTASYLDLDDVPYSIEGINVLVAEENGGVIIKTPQKKSIENKSRTQISGELKNTGDFTFEADITTIGNPKNYFKAKLAKNGNEDDILFLQNIFNNYYANVSVEKFNINDNIQDQGKYNLNLDGVYKKFVTTSTKRIFINPNIYDKITSDDLPKEKVDERKSPIFYNYPYLDIDTVTIKVPDFFAIESIPSEKSIENSFAKYFSKCTYENNTIKYFRHYEIKENLIPLEQYQEYLDFLKFVIKADKAELVFKKDI